MSYDGTYEPFGPRYPAHPWFRKETHSRLSKSGETKERFTNPTPNIAPLNIVKPEISGVAIFPGGKLDMTSGVWLGPDPITFVYRWFRDAVLIVGATEAFYIPVALDVGAKITGFVDATNGVGTNSEETSNGVTVIAAP